MFATFVFVPVFLWCVIGTQAAELADYVKTSVRHSASKDCETPTDYSRPALKMEEIHFLESAARSASSSLGRTSTQEMPLTQVMHRMAT